THVGQLTKWLGELDAAVVDPRTDAEADPELTLYAKRIQELGVNLDAEPDCIGILVIGTFRKTPVEARTEPSFSHNVARTISRPRRLRALTGLQLLCLLLEGREKEATKAAAVELIFSPTGVLEDTSNWKRHLVVHKN